MLFMFRATVGPEAGEKRANRNSHVNLVILLAGIALLLIVTAYVILNLVKNPPEQPALLRVSFPLEESLTSYDPAHIATLAQAHFLDNIYSPLIELDNDGNIVPGIARSFEWRGDDLRLEIRADLFTADGKQITAEDAAFSLKRLVFLGNSNTHGDLGQFLCPNHSMKSIQEECRGIRIEDNYLILTVADSYKKSFLLPLLANPDFSVIPISSFDLEKPELPIADYRNTSGPYFVESVDEVKRVWTLAANKQHYRYHRKIPQVVEMRESRGQDSLNLLKDGQLDMISLADSVDPREVREFGKKNENHFSTHITQNIRLVYLKFSPKALKRLSVETRRFVGKEIRRYRRPYL